MSLFNRKRHSDLPRRRIVTGANITSEQSIGVRNLSNVFKRNRTLSGVISPNLDSPRSKVHHLVNRRRKVFSTFMVVLLATLFLWTLINNFTAKVDISVSGSGISKKVDKTVYERAVQEYLDMNPMERFSFVLNQSSLNSYISSKLPEVLSIKYGSSLGMGKTNFSVKMRQPVAGWIINKEQYYVDSAGVPFVQDYYANPVVKIVDNSGASPTTGAGGAIASNRFLSFVGKVVALSKYRGYTVTEATLPLNTTRQLEVRLGEGDFLVKMSIDRVVEEQIEDMARAVEYFKSRGQKPDYIDVRVSGKAFYK